MIDSHMPAWERRFRAPTVTFPSWSADAPDRVAVASNETGSYQVYAWDRVAGTRRRMTDDPIGVPGASVTADGSGAVWFHDETGDEFGHWLIQPFDGGETRKLFPDIPDGWSTGLALGRRVAVVGVGDRDGMTIYRVVEGNRAQVLMKHRELLQVGGGVNPGSNVGGLSRDETLVCIEHCEHGDNLHPALRVFDVRSGRAVGNLWDGPARGLSAWAWSPTPGDQRLALVHELEDLERPAIWDLATGERRDLKLELPGAVTVHDWWPDGSALLLIHLFEGRDEILRLEPETGDLTPIPHPPGALSGARVRPDGSVWFRTSSGSHQARVLDDRGTEVIAALGERAPEGRPFQSWHFGNPRGQRVHGFLAMPPGPGPYPVVIEIHGGPQSLYMDAWAPQVQAFVDHGFAVAMINYRGSTGYGAEWRDAIIGKPGLTELEDVVAGLDDLVASRLVDPERAVVHGESWGGYLALLAAGLHPDRWVAAIAGVPVADYVAAYEDEGVTLQAMDRGLFGGGPDEFPELYRERSPITYVERVKAPLLILAGENDMRCPIRQIDNYVEALEARGGDVEVYRYKTGHSSFVVDERVSQVRTKLDFLLSRVSIPAE